MQTRERLYAAALRQVQSRRQKAIMQAQAARDKALQAIPGLQAAELEMLRRHTAAARLGSLKANPEQWEQARQAANQSQNVYQALLAEHGWSEAMFRPKFHCPLCQDKGIFEGHTCRCVHLLVRDLRRQEISAVSALELCHFETFRLDYYPTRQEEGCPDGVRAHMEQIFQFCQKYAEHFTPQNPSLLMTGTAGLGKTHLALSIANTALGRGYDAVYISARALFDQLEKEKFLSSSELAATVMGAELLILDDLGTEFLTQYGLSFLYDLVNSRMLRRLPTIYTTNITQEAMLRARYTEKTASRLLGSCELLPFYGDDIRLRDF